MPLTIHQIRLIQDSFLKVEPIADHAAVIFYNKLFEINPILKPLFKKDISEQGRVLMSTLKVAVNGLNDIEGLAKTLQKLADRHVKYGVRPEDYTSVGNALLQTLKEGLGDDFTPETREAWVTVYRLMAKTMKEHAYSFLKN